MSPGRYGLGWFLWLILGAALGCQGGPRDLIRRYQRAINAGDVTAVASLYAPNITYEMVGAWLKSGPVEVRALADWDRVLQTELRITGCIPSGTRWVCQAAESNRWLKAAGIARLRYQVEFVIEDQQIHQVRATMEPTDARRLERFLGRMKRWLEKNRPEMLKLLLPGGKLRHGEQPANLWIGLLRVYEAKLASP